MCTILIMMNIHILQFVLRLAKSKKNLLIDKNDKNGQFISK